MITSINLQNQVLNMVTITMNYSTSYILFFVGYKF
jgi:hypothetical protein